ncbi:MAG: hypothetical protein IKG39_01500 [Lachnospiraceae bacterium]|nr:hypothetical protein [Lachnospiraceae bacterium]
MGVFDNFPYTNFHDLNLDWLLQAFKKLQDEWDSFGYEVTAEAVAGLYPDVEVTGDLTNGLNFKFTLVKGDQGDTGATGAPGADGNGIESVSWDPLNASLTFTFTNGDTFTTPSLRGPQGQGLQILDVYATLADLQTAHPVGNAGDMYQVGTAPNFTLYLWSPSQNAYVNAGALTTPAASNTTPIVDTGEGDPGTEYAFARGDHYHPTDTSRASVSDLNALAGRVTDTEGDIVTLTNDLGTANGNITLLQGQMLGKQDTLVAGTNIKNINGLSPLGSGNISLEDLLDIHLYSGTEEITSTSAVVTSYDVALSAGHTRGYILATLAITSGSSASGTGQAIANILTNIGSYGRSYTTQQSATTQTLSTVCTVFIPVIGGMTSELSLNTVCSKPGSKIRFWNIITMGCTLTQQE